MLSIRSSSFEKNVCIFILYPVITDREYIRTGCYYKKLIPKILTIKNAICQKIIIVVSPLDYQVWLAGFYINKSWFPKAFYWR